MQETDSIEALFEQAVNFYGDTNVIKLIIDKEWQKIEKLFFKPITFEGRQEASREE